MLQRRGISCITCWCTGTKVYIVSWIFCGTFSKIDLFTDTREKNLGSTYCIMAISGRHNAITVGFISMRETDDIIRCRVQVMNLLKQYY